MQTIQAILKQNKIAVNVRFSGGDGGGSVVINDTNFLGQLNATNNTATKNGVIIDPAIVSGVAPNPISGYYIVSVSGSLNIDNITDVGEGQTVFFREGLWSAEYNPQVQITEHIQDLDNPHQVNKAQIGLSNVDNTSDINKPVSIAVQTEINRIDDELEVLANNQRELAVGNILLFDKSYIYGTYATPIVGDMTIDGTSAIVGTGITIIHNDVNEPIITGANKIGGDYLEGSINVIEVLYDGTDYIYSIISNA